MKFTDIQSENFIIKLSLKKELFSQLLNAYIESNSWKKRLKICNELLVKYQLVDEGKFKEFEFAFDLNKITFEFLKDQSQNQTIIDYNSSLFILNRIFEILKQHCKSKLNLPSKIKDIEKRLENQILAFYRYVKFNSNDLTQYFHLNHKALGLKIISKKLLKLPSERSKK